MTTLRDRMAALETALREQQTIEIEPPRSQTPVRHSLDHRFDKPAPEGDARPAPTPSQEKGNPFESITSAEHEKSKYYDSIAASFGLGILDEEEFVDYTIYDAFITNLRVCPVHLNDKGRYYYVEHRSFLPNVPGVILHEGTEKTGKCLGVAHIPLTGQNSIGIGDIHHSPHTMRWEKMGNTGFWTHMKYEFVHELENGARKKFNWIRTRNNIMDDQGDLVLVEEGKEGTILAEYLGKGLLKWKKRGRLRIREVEAFGKDWEVMVLLSWASVVELSRRRARIRRYSPTHLIGI